MFFVVALRLLTNIHEHKQRTNAEENFCQCKLNDPSKISQHQMEGPGRPAERCLTKGCESKHDVRAKQIRRRNPARLSDQILRHLANDTAFCSRLTVSTPRVGSAASVVAWVISLCAHLGSLHRV